MYIEEMVMNPKLIVSQIIFHDEMIKHNTVFNMIFLDLF